MKTMENMAWKFRRNSSIFALRPSLARSSGVLPRLKANHSLPQDQSWVGRPGIRCVAIYWKQLRLTLDLCFLSYPIWNLLNVKAKKIRSKSFGGFPLDPSGINALCNNSWSKLGAQAVPLKNLASRTGEGHSIQILSFATLQVYCK